MSTKMTILLIIFTMEVHLKNLKRGSLQTYLHFFGLSTALVAELYQCDHHGQTQSSNQDVEDSCYITERQSTGLFLGHKHVREKGQPTGEKLG